MRYDTILFDFDGTITPSLELWLESFQYALRRFNRTLPEETIIRRFFYREYQDVADEFALPSGAELREHVHDGLMQAFGTVRLYPGVRDVLDWCRAVGLATGLVTSSPRPQVEHALTNLGILDLFDATVTGSDVTHFKPHPEPVQAVLGLLGRPPERTLLVGDWEADVLAGHAAGTQVALFLPLGHTKFYDFAALRALDPAFEFDDWTQLQAYLKLDTDIH